MLFGQGKKLCQRAHRRKGKKRPRKGEGRVLRSPQQEIEACQGGLELASDFLQIGLGSHRLYPGFDNLELGNVSFLKKFLSRPSQLLSGLDKSRSDPVSLLRQEGAQESLASSGDDLLTPATLLSLSDLRLSLGYADPVGPFEGPLKGLGKAIGTFLCRLIVGEGESGVGIRPRLTHHPESCLHPSLCSLREGVHGQYLAHHLLQGQSTLVLGEKREGRRKREEKKKGKGQRSSPRLGKAERREKESNLVFQPFLPLSGVPSYWM